METDMGLQGGGGAKLSADSHFPASLLSQYPYYSSKLLYVSKIARELSLAKNNQFSRSNSKNRILNNYERLRKYHLLILL